MLSLNNLPQRKGEGKKRKRIGRGNASGHGTYSCKGLKGQKSRSGVSRGKLKRLGMKQMVLSVPKKRGFKSLRPCSQTVNLFQLNEKFQDKSVITPRALLKVGLIDKIKEPIKLLGKGDLKLKDLTISNIQISQTAKEQVEKLGGKIK